MPAEDSDSAQAGASAFSSEKKKRIGISHKEKKIHKVLDNRERQDKVFNIPTK